MLPWQAMRATTESRRLCSFQFQAQACECRGGLGQARRVGLRQIDHGGQQQRLGGDAAVEQLAAQNLMGQTLMRGMLIHQNERGIGGGGDDIGVQHLCQRRAERMGGRIGQGHSRSRMRAARRRRIAQRQLRFGKTGVARLSRPSEAKAP